MAEAARKRILFVDDEMAILEATMMLLEERYEVTGATRGDVALTLFQEGDFDLVVSDIIMPGLDGLQLFAAVRKIRPQQPFVFVSVSELFFQDPQVESILHQQADGFLGKPFRFEDLLALVDRVLSRPEPAPPA
ncbi:MAG: response regulator [Thermodesulfobacteriota bacterium]